MTARGAEVAALPLEGEVLFDARDSGRTLRIGWHPDERLCVLSIWRDGRCVASFQMPRGAAPELIGALTDGLARQPVPSWSQASYTRAAHRPRWYVRRRGST